MRTFSRHLFRIALTLMGEYLVAMLCIASLLGGSITLPTGSRAIFHVDRVLGGEQVSTLANQGTLIAERATAHILDVSERLKVVGVDASTHTTPVIQFFTFRHGADQPFVGDDISLPGAVAIIGYAVPFRVYWAGPQPARIGFINLRPKQSDVVASKFSAWFGDSLFGREAMPIQSGAKGQVRHSATRIAGPFRKTFGFPEGRNQPWFHVSISSHDLQSSLGGNRLWRERVSARENLSPQRLYIGATA